MRLDLKDRKILYQLDLNARQSYAQIAKKVRLSKESVQYRIKRLQQTGIIKYFMAIIDSNKLGYTLYRNFIKCQNLDEKKEKEIIDYVHDKVGWVVNIRGKWDFNIAIWRKNNYEFMEFWNDFYSKFSNIIVDYTSNPIPTMRLYRRAWLLGLKKDTSEYDEWGTSNKIVETDDLDKQLLRLLVRNARMSSVELGRKLEVTEGTIRNRMRRLEKQKVILRYVALLDTAAAGMKYFKLHFSAKNIDKKTTLRISEFAHLHPYVLYENTAVGGFYLEYDVNVPSSEALYKLIDEFRAQFIDVIKDYEFFEYVKEYKFEYLPVR